MRFAKLVAVILFLFILGCIGLFITALRPVQAQNETTHEVMIVAGQSTSKISQELYRQGLVRNSFAFYLYLKVFGGKVLPGTYEVTTAMSSSNIGQILSKGAFKTVKITIIEGWRVTQITDYLTTEKHLKNVSDFTEKAQPYEGYLFPDTYDVKVDITSTELIELMRQNFTKKTAELHLTPETVILASIVEREAKTDEERGTIAGVYANRLKKNMKLEADPTVQYAKGSWAAPTRDDLKISSPYNTYVITGLPPGPICNPGLASLKAAAEPESNDYIYFFHAKGQTYFSKTLAEHNAKLAQFR